MCPVWRDRTTRAAVATFPTRPLSQNCPVRDFQVKFPPLPELPIPPSFESRNVEAAEQSAAATLQATQVAERSLTIAERSLWASGILGGLTLTIALATALYARQALSTWQAQMFGEHQYGSAMAALRALQGIRVLIVNRRASLGSQLTPPSPIQFSSSDPVEQMAVAKAEALARDQNKAGQQAHYEFAVALNGQRDALEQALVGLEPQWGAEFTALLNAASQRLDEFARASNIKENLLQKNAVPSLRDIQLDRTPESEQTDVQHRALLWLGVPALRISDNESEAARLLQAQVEILLPITRLESWLNGKLAELTGSRRPVRGGEIGQA